ncbi:outer membrane protein assembly factor [Schlesneria sp. T3-172]|uniref:BamA/OMP85 family outer membrane protein n=1 Tax=Schlesneria sphaerica TaxID=3373610 RepID=UPI0037C90800
MPKFFRSMVAAGIVAGSLIAVENASGQYTTSPPSAAKSKTAKSSLVEPEHSLDLPTPKRTTTTAADRKDRSAVKLPKTSGLSGIRPVAAFEGDEDKPDTPFHLDESLVDVVIEGNSTIPNPEIAKHIKTRPGRPVTQKQIKDDVDALVRTRWFASVEPTLRRTDDGVVLVFRVLERPIVRRVEYKGLKKIKQKVFDSMTQLRPGSPFDVSSNRECARRIEEYYHEKGYAFATVELEKGNDRDDREVVFLINEGPKVAVSGVEFDGNEDFYDGILKTKTRTKTQILWLFGGKYDPASIKDDIEGVKQYYHSLGYFDVDIKHTLKFSEDRSKVKILYTIDEGIRYKIRSIEVDGNNVISEEEIRGMMKVAEGVHYNTRDINKDVDAIRTKYGEQGRLFCRVDAVPRWTEDDGIVDIVYKIEEDKVYRIRNLNVHIQGDHPHTRTNLVRNISPVQPGDLADPKKIHLMKRRLEGSQNFETGPEGGVRIETNVVRNPNWVDKRDYDNIVRSQSAPIQPHTTLRNRTEGKPEKPTRPAKGARPRTQPTTETSANRRPEGLQTQGAVQPLTGLQGWVGTNESREESRDPFVTVASHFDQIAQPITLPEPKPREVFDEGLSPITPIFRAQSRDPLQPPANFGFDNSPQGDPFGKAIRDPDPGDWTRMEPPEFIDLDAYVSEARTGRLMFGVGVNSDAGVIGNIVLSEQNFDILKPPRSWSDITNGTAFRGGGQKFKIEAMPGSQVSRYLVDWQDPYFLDTNFNLGLSGFYFTRYYRNWYEDRTGGRIRLGRQLTQTWSTAVALRLEDVNIYNPYLPTPPLLAASVGSNFLSTIRGSLMHDTRDAAFGTTSGHYVDFSYEQAFGEYSYPRFEAEARQYFTTYQRIDGQGKHTLMVRGQASWSGNDTPIFERFFAGGFQTFRGFAFRGVSPMEGGVYTGGNFMVLGGAEYMLPVTANEMIKVVGFTDFGTVNDNVSLSNFRLSLGGGLRVTVPAMGPVPIALDLAVPLMKEEGDIQQVFAFYIGVNR